jgi:hypothetical protein
VGIRGSRIDRERTACGSLAFDRAPIVKPGGRQRDVSVGVLG